MIPTGGSHVRLPQQVPWAIAMELLLTAQTIDSAVGSIDTITAGTGNDILLGGAAGDTLDADQGNNIILGDNGRVTFVNGVIDLVESLDAGIGGQDDIDSRGSGTDVPRVEMAAEQHDLLRSLSAANLADDVRRLNVRL